MEKAKQLLQLRQAESESVLRLAVNPHEFQVGPSFFEDFALRGIRVDRVEPDMIFCTFVVPPRLIVSSLENPLLFSLFNCNFVAI